MNKFKEMEFVKKIIKVYQSTKKKGIGLLSAGLTFYALISTISLTLLTIAFIPQSQIELIMTSINIFAGDAATEALYDVAGSASFDGFTILTIFTLIWSSTTSITYTLYALRLVYNQKTRHAFSIRLKAFAVLALSLISLYVISYTTSIISIGTFQNISFINNILNSQLGLIFAIITQLAITFIFFYTTYKNTSPTPKKINLRVTISILAAIITTFVSSTITTYTNSSIHINNPVIVHLITLLLFLYVLFYTLLIGATAQKALDIPTK